MNEERIGRKSGTVYRFRVDTKSASGEVSYTVVDTVAMDIADAWTIFTPWLGGYAGNLDTTKTVVRVRVLGL